MATVRGVFDAAKHPRGFHGRFGASGRAYSARNVGRKGLSRISLRDAERSGKRSFMANTYAGGTTRAYSNVVGRKKSVVKFTPAVFSTPSGYREGIGRFKYTPRGEGLFTPTGFRPKRKG